MKSIKVCALLLAACAFVACSSAKKEEKVDTVVVSVSETIEVAVEDAAAMLGAPVYFDFDSSSLTPASKAVLAKAGKELGSHKNVTLKVIGHTDSTGTDAYNIALSDRRAQAVKSALVKEGVKNEVQVVAMGPFEPKESNDTKAGRKANRRAEIFVIKAK